MTPVLLVHGFATSAERTWGDNGWIDLLRDVGRTVIAVDLLGHGRADKPHDPAAYDQLEALVAAELPDEPVDAIGFSLGARVILTIAAEQPERFNRIVVTGVGANLFRDEPRDLIASAVRGEGDIDNPVAQYFAGLARQPGNDTEALVACMSSPRQRLDDGRLGKITAPVLVVIGENDFAGPGDPLADALPDATLVTLRGLDHFATPKDFRTLDAALEFIGAV
ncbi:MAG TPA: alpha/beta fold hydrolase [Acidimicrobiales bacterium]|nr:alpha/beta fold hydrolase [Acidimicrobiales bacterium]